MCNMTDYSFYREHFSGGLTAEQWQVYGKRAAAQLERFKRIYAVDAPEADSEDMAVCAMAEALAWFTDAKGGAVSSAAIGSVSVKYTSPDISSKALEQELLRCAKVYLVIYRGVGVCAMS